MLLQTLYHERRLLSIVKSTLLYSTVAELLPKSSSRERVHKCNFYARKADKREYNFTDYSVKTIGERTERKIYYYPKMSVESVLSKYLVKQIKKKSGIKFSSKTQMVNDIMLRLGQIDDDITLIRTDFVSFFYSVRTADVFRHYIEPIKDRFRSFEYDLIEDYCTSNDSCYAGLPMSATLCELPLAKLEETVRANPRVLALYRYVDDMFFIVRGKWEKDDFLAEMKTIIADSFYGSQVLLHEEPDKFSCIYLREVKEKATAINFLFRDFTIYRKNGRLEYFADIDIFRRRMIKNSLKTYFEDYIKDGDFVKLKYRIALYSSFSVFENEIFKSRLSYIEWHPSVLYYDLMINPAIYGEITIDFLMECIPSLIKEYGLENEPLICNIERKILLNGKSFLFVRPKGLSRKDVVSMLKELDSDIDTNNKDYNELVILLMEKLL